MGNPLAVQNTLKGAGTGASAGVGMGAALGTALLPIPGVGTAVGAGVGLLAGAIGGAMKKEDPLKKQQRMLLQQEIARMRRGELGLSQSEKDQRIAQANLTAGAQIQAAQLEATRQQGGGGFSGQEAEERRKMQDAQATVAAQASAQANTDSDQMAQKRAAAAQSGMAQQRAQTEQERVNANQEAMTGLSQLGSAMAATTTALEGAGAQAEVNAITAGSGEVGAMNESSRLMASNFQALGASLDFGEDDMQYFSDDMQSYLTEFGGGIETKAVYQGPTGTDNSLTLPQFQTKF